MLPPDAWNASWMPCIEHESSTLSMRPIENRNHWLAKQFD